jgi:hypothetical protein
MNQNGAIYSVRTIGPSSSSIHQSIKFVEGDRPGVLHLNANTVQTLGKREKLCEDERFREQPSLYGCSGFLVGEDIFVTAGHCLRAKEGMATAKSECLKRRIIFGLGYEERPGDDLYTSIEVTKDDVYSCIDVLDAQHSGGGDTDTDYAIIRLDRPVVGRLPLRYAGPEYEIEIGQEEIVIGHPTGLPMKIADNAFVKTVAELRVGASSDTFYGNSGSPVFDDEGTVIAIHATRTSKDHFKAVPSGPYDYCQVPVNCTDEPDLCYNRGGYPRHFRISAIAEHLDRILKR